MSWANVKMDYLGRVVTGKTPPTKQRKYFDGEYPFITPSDLQYDSFRVTKTATTVTEEAKSKFANQFLPENAVTYTCIASVGKIGITTMDSLTNQQINSIIVNDAHDYRFVYYLLRNETRRIQGMCSGVATPIINKSDFEKVDIRVPINQKVEINIASILSAYDDLIENNRRRIQLLEQAARLLYKEWFVHLRFPGHEHTKIINGIPAGWEKKTLGEFAPLNYGRALKEDNRISGSFPVYGSSGIVGSHIKALVSGPTIIVGRKGNVGSVYWSSDDCWPIDTVYYIDTSKCNFFLYYTLQSMSFISTDVAVPGLNRDLAHSRNIIFPEVKILQLFEDTVIPLHKQMDVLRNTIERLQKARDLLLPRLMNGEIAV